MKHTLVQFLALGVLASAVSAQKTWIVDASGGAGSQATSIAAAVALASAGDRIQVRAGRYEGTDISKPLTILGEGGARLVISTNQPALAISNIAANQSFTVRGFVVELEDVAAALVIRNCAGRVSVMDMVIEKHRAAFIGGVQIEDSGAVTLDRCDFGVPLIFTRSVAVVTQCEVAESQLFFGPSACVNLAKSNVTLVQCGANRDGRMQGTRAAVSCTESHLQLRGNANSLYRGSLEFIRGGTIIQHEALRGDALSTLVMDPAVQLTSPQIVGFASKTSRSMPWLTATGGQLGQTVDLAIHSAATEPLALFVGLPAAPTSVLTWGEVWLDLGFFVPVLSGAQSAQGVTQTQRAVPTLPSLAGVNLAYQGIAGAMSLELTNAATMTLFAR